MKGYRTFLFNGITGLVTLTGAALQYVDMLGLTDRQTAFAAITVTLIQVAANIYLRSITNTAPFRGE